MWSHHTINKLTHIWHAIFVVSICFFVNGQKKKPSHEYGRIPPGWVVPVVAPAVWKSEFVDYMLAPRALGFVMDGFISAEEVKGLQ